MKKIWIVIRLIWLMALNLALAIYGKIVYVPMYMTRKWARNVIYAKDRYFITHVVHAKSLSRVYDVNAKSECKSIVCRIAKFIWWHLDDTPEWSDAGGSRFGRENCSGDTGINIDCMGSYLEKRNATEKDGCNNKTMRRFWCSYKWSALRNPMVNFQREKWTIHKEISKYWIHKNTVDGTTAPAHGKYYGKLRSPKMKIKDGLYDPEQSIEGTLIYETETKDGKKYPCIDMTVPVIGGKYMISMWTGYLRGTLRYEFAMRFAKVS